MTIADHDQESGMTIIEISQAMDHLSRLSDAELERIHNSLVAWLTYLTRDTDVTTMLFDYLDRVEDIRWL